MTSDRADKALEELFPPIFKRTKGKVARIQLSSQGSDGLKPSSLLTAKEKAWGVVQKKPEVMLKFGKADVKSFTHIQEIANYLARNGKIQLEDQNGNIYEDKKQYTALLRTWQEIQGIPETKSKRSHARRFILSMPAGTNEQKFAAACREWAKSNLYDFDYLLAFHNPSNDLRTGQPHCHVLIRNLSREGKRLHIDNMRRDAMRESFAACLSRHGIKANATSRWVRGRTEKGLKQPEFHAAKRFQSEKERARAFAIDKKRKLKQLKTFSNRQKEIQNHLERNTDIPDHPGITKAKKRRKQLQDTVRKTVQELSASPDSNDRKLAESMQAYYSNLGLVESRQQRELREAKETKAKQIRRMQAAKNRFNGASR